MSPDHARALAMAYELQGLLHRMTQARDNPRVDAAMDLLDGVLDELDTLGQGPQDTHALRLLVTEPRQYEAHRTRQAVHGLATKPWRRP
jgi:hypothetical protein